MALPITQPPDLTIEQVAAELSIHPETVRSLIRAGWPPVYKLGHLQRDWIDPGSRL